MKVYIPSTISTPYGTIGRGHHDASLIAARANVPATEIETFFDSLISTGMAVPDAAPAQETRTASAKEKPKTAIK